MRRPEIALEGGPFEAALRGIRGNLTSRSARSGQYVNRTDQGRPGSNRRSRTELDPVSLYLGSDDAVVALNVYRELSNLLKELGIEHQIADVGRGSLWLKCTAWLRKGETKAELKRKLKDVSDHAEMYGKALAHRAPAEVDNINAGTVGSLIAAAGDADLCVVLGQVYILKGRRPDGSVFCIGGQLSAHQARYIDNNPSLKADPWTLLQYLEEGVQLEGLLNPPAVEGAVIDAEDDEEDPPTTAVG